MAVIGPRSAVAIPGMGRVLLGLLPVPIPAGAVRRRYVITVARRCDRCTVSAQALDDGGLEVTVTLPAAGTTPVVAVTAAVTSA